ncbi:hypothetical protein GGQ88_001302 [Novosphingobium hassiacum]|uniref:DUF4071 domain-containing protein n=1 Tax=Novosphingobium hassiacum TaxID=173676 RepID=A0A7W6EVD5_9SPHN|nr:hypothetical protein [Novosphingobium hassiacum]MBB3860041.1 hypothetical protein [Novosphingobium hassiacum]
MTLLAGLPAIITAARAGAIGYAERLFRDGGYDRLSDDPAALAVHARLLKDRALCLPPVEREAGFAQAAAAYARADALGPQLYTRLNVATLTLLAGDRARAAVLAGELLAWLGGAQPLHETPFLIAAAKAEAHLLRGDGQAAQAALARAIAQAPRAFEDHASTLRQLRMICEATGSDDRWLDAFRPPAAMHYAGHLGVGAKADGALIERIDDMLAASHVGFAFGALAAGADLTIAERVLESGGELHVVLPLREDAFVAQSVRPYGADWEARFLACRDAAASWTETARDTGAYEPLASHLAADVAMGSAVRHSRSLGSEAMQLVIVDDAPGPLGAGIHTARDVERWASTGRATQVLRAPRAAPVVASGARTALEGRADRRLAAMLQIEFAGLADLDEAGLADAVADVLLPFRTALADLAAKPEVVLPCGNSRIMAFTDPESAYAFARAALLIPTGQFGLTIAGHYGLAHWLSDPEALIGRPVDQLGAIAAVAFPGTITVSEAFASALFLAAGDEVYAEPLGEVGELRIHALRRVAPGLA